MVFLVVCCYRQDGRLVTEPGSATKFSGLSVIEQECEPVLRDLTEMSLGSHTC